MPTYILEFYNMQMFLMFTEISPTQERYGVELLHGQVDVSIPDRLQIRSMDGFLQLACFYFI